MDALVGLLLAWIGTHSPYDTAHLTPPQVVEVSPEVLTARFYQGRAHLMPDDGVEDRLNALYLSGHGDEAVIYIRPADQVAGAATFDDPHDNPIWREILLHELVHHAQHAAGGDSWTCVARGEAEAYRLGGLYFTEKDLPDPMTDRAGAAAQLYNDC